MVKFIISLDGPAGSGKQRIAKYIARKYIFFHLDSGLLYRRLAIFFIKNKIDYNNKTILKKFLQKIDLLSHRNHPSLRRENISNISSIIAKKILIRKFIDKQQKLIVNRMINKYKGCVVDGRDIGSKVFKDAKIKLFIQVSSKIRAKRRHKQLIALGEKSIYAQILKDIKLRDETDKNRKLSPLVIPKGAIIIDNSKSFKKTIELLNNILKEKL